MAGFKTINVPEELHDELKRLAKVEAERLHLPSLSIASLIAQMVSRQKAAK